MSVVARIARALEDGAVPRWAIARAAADGWGRIASRGVARPLRLPEGVRVVAIGGATLGGSGKTPLALAVGRRAADESGADVAIVGHAYRASPRQARWVTPDDPVALVGDEALACARDVAREPTAGRLRVAIAPRRQAAIDFAVAEGATVLVLDGVAQTAPRRASQALLAIDAADPWGAGEVPPLGDLRAPREALLDACDEVVALRDSLASRDAMTCAGVGAVRFVDVSSRGVWLEGVLVPWSELTSLRIGLATSIARPTRVTALLERRGISPSVVVFGADHGELPLTALATKRVDLWLTTAKCAAHVSSADGRLDEWARRALRGAPMAHIDHLATP